MGSEILITGSLAWLIIWSFFGMLAGKQHPEWLEKIKTIYQEGDLGKFWSTYDSYIIQKTGHAHANSLVCVTFFDRLGNGSRCYRFFAAIPNYTCHLVFSRCGIGRFW